MFEDLLHGTDWIDGLEILLTYKMVTCMWIRDSELHSQFKKCSGNAPGPHTKTLGEIPGMPF